jgi:uncharacterized cupin superfamily protein
MPRARGFRIIELQLSPTQKVPWHSHTNITDTFYVLEGHMRLFLQDPKEEVNLKPGEVHVVRAARPHLVTNGGTKSLTFLVLSGIGEYDYVPLTSSWPLAAALAPKPEIVSEDWRQSCSILLKLSSKRLSGSLKIGTAKSMESLSPPIRTSLVLLGASR